MSETYRRPFFFFFNDTATTEIYTLSLHDALPISPASTSPRSWRSSSRKCRSGWATRRDRKSTRLNSSHLVISYAVFCLKKKKRRREDPATPRPAAFRIRSTSVALSHRPTGGGTND